LNNIYLNYFKAKERKEGRERRKTIGRRSKREGKGTEYVRREGS
jgi:hypothetical protein